MIHNSSSGIANAAKQRRHYKCRLAARPQLGGICNAAQLHALQMI